MKMKTLKIHNPLSKQVNWEKYDFNSSRDLSRESLKN